MMRTTGPIRSLGRVAVTVALIAAACGGTDGTAAPAISGTAAPETSESIEGTTVTVMTHDAFAISDSVIEAFEAETGATVEFVTSGDTGQLVSQAVLTKDNPVADVLYGVDNTFLSRALDAEIFEPFAPTALADVPDEFELDPQQRVTPINYGDVCVNYWTDLVDGPVPDSLDGLLNPALAGQFVTENPETSSPGLALLLATIAKYGEDGWEDYWAGLRDNDVRVTSGWTEAYFGEFIAGGGTVPIVTSYASSPVAEVVFADPRPDAAPTGVITDGCFRQVEFAGVLSGADEPAAARAFIDFMLSPTFQEDIPLSMFVFPVNETATPPADFTDHAVQVDAPLTLDIDRIGEMRDTWTERWVEIVLR